MPTTPTKPSAPPAFSLRDLASGDTLLLSRAIDPSVGGNVTYFFASLSRADKRTPGSSVRALANLLLRRLSCIFFSPSRTLACVQARGEISPVGTKCTFTSWTPSSRSGAAYLTLSAKLTARMLSKSVSASADWTRRGYSA